MKQKQINRRRVKRLRRLLLWLFLGSVAVMIFFFSAQNGEESSRMSTGVLKMVTTWLKPCVEFVLRRTVSQETMQMLIRKLAHFSEYMLLGFCLTLLLREYNWRFPHLFAALLGTGYAITDELHQLLSDGRSASPVDVAIDASGVLLGLLLAKLLWGLVHLLKVRTRRRQQG